MIELYQLKYAHGAAPLNLKVMPSGHNDQIIGRTVKLVDELDEDKIAQIRADNLAFKASFRQALIADYGQPNSERAISAAQAEAPRANLTNGNDIFLSDLNLIIAHATAAHNEPLLNDFFKSGLSANDVRVGGCSAVIPGKRENLAHFDTLYLDLLQDCAYPDMKHLPPEASHTQRLADAAHKSLFYAAIRNNILFNGKILPKKAENTILSFAKLQALIGKVILVQQHIQRDLLPVILRLIVALDPPARSQRRL